MPLSPLSMQTKISRRLLRAQVTASSPTCRFTDPKAVVSGHFLRNNAAGQRRDGGIWWRVDLGEQHLLMCNYYTMRHDASPDYPRSWTLQVHVVFLEL